VTDTRGYREQWRTSADGLALYNRLYDRAGSTVPVVLCLPGLTRNSKDFETLAAHLAPRYRVICPDLRGRGQSARDPIWRNYHPGTYLADLSALLAELGVKRFAVVGTSLGGLLGMMLPSVRPGAVAGVVLNDIGPEIDPAGAERIRTYAGKLPAVHDWREAIAQMKFVYGVAWPDLDEAAWERIAKRSYREDEAGMPALDVDPMVGEALRAAPAASTGGDLWPLFESLKTLPMLAIRGALSDILSVAVFERMQREHPGLKALSVGNRGHVPLLDEPECVQAIDEFLAALSF
jgi:pimeloyl-ACP methyl ester carboxylesterase